MSILKKAESSISSGESQKPMQSTPKNSRTVQKLTVSGISGDGYKGGVKIRCLVESCLKTN